MGNRNDNTGRSQQAGAPRLSRQQLERKIGLDHTFPYIDRQDEYSFDRGETALGKGVKTALAGIFARAGVPLTERAVRAMAGVPPSGTLIIKRMDSGALLFHAFGPPLPAGQTNEETKLATNDRQWDMQRRLTLDPATGAPVFMRNIHFEVDPSARRQGIGTTAFATESQMLNRLGVEKITAEAGREGNPLDGFGTHSYNGYAVWPEMGYDARMQYDSIKKALNTPVEGSRKGLGDTPANRTAYLKPLTLAGRGLSFDQQQALETAITPLSAKTHATLRQWEQEGRNFSLQDFRALGPDAVKWWLYHGKQMEMAYDLRKGSRSRTTHARYLRDQRNKGKSVIGPATLRISAE